MLTLDDLSCSPIVGIDPGSVHVGACWFCLANAKQIGETHGPEEAVSWCRTLGQNTHLHDITVAIERPMARGQNVTQDLLDTCVVVGRLVEALRPIPVFLVPRASVKLALLGFTRGEDSKVHAALVDMWGGREKAVGRKGTKKKPGTPGPLYGIKGPHVWDALAVAVAFAGRKAAGIEARCVRYPEEKGEEHEGNQWNGATSRIG